MEKEEVTDAQLSCLHYKLQSGQTPFIDMGVWGPHGDRIARAMRFVSQQWRDGPWKAVELPGATNLDAWEESWRIFWTGALMLQMATAATLDRYAAEFRARVLQHPDVWHLAAQADIRCRTEARSLSQYPSIIVSIQPSTALEFSLEGQRFTHGVLVERV